MVKKHKSKAAQEKQAEQVSFNINNSDADPDLEKNSDEDLDHFKKHCCGSGAF